MQGTFPVILTFKNCTEDTWEDAYRKFIELIVLEFERCSKILAPELSPDELYKYKDITSGKAHSTLYTHSLFFLSMLLERHYKNRVIILIDEYDAPIHAAYTNGYYKEMIKFLRSLLTAALKDNDYLERGILTGVLRTAKEGVFYGLNNLRVKTLLDDEFSDKFGFTPQEVTQLVIDTNLPNKNDLIREWYNGYQCGTSTIYNPWSVLECVSNKGASGPYWVNTSDNELIKKIIAQADNLVKEELEGLLNNTQVERRIDTSLILPGIENNSQAIWSLLLFAGYLTFTKVEKVEDINVYTLVIPNKEIKLLYRDLITAILEQALNLTQIRNLKESLLEANSNKFGEILQEFTLKSMSTFDLPKTEP